MKRTTITLPDDLESELDQWMTINHVRNENEAIRILLRHSLAAGVTTRTAPERKTARAVNGRKNAE